MHAPHPLESAQLRPHPWSAVHRDAAAAQAPRGAPPGREVTQGEVRRAAVNSRVCVRGQRQGRLCGEQEGAGHGQRGSPWEDIAAGLREGSG